MMENASSSVPRISRRMQIVTPQRHLFSLNIKEIWQYRALIPLLIRRDFFGEFSQTLLGPMWFVVHPLVQSVIFALIFGNLAKMSTDGASPFLFYNCAFVLWVYFTTSTTYVSNVFITNAGLFGKVYFPRLIIPIAIASFRLITFAVNLVLFIFFLILFHYKGVPLNYNMWVLATPVLLLQTFLLSIGVGTLASAVTARFRDMMQAISYLFAVWMYATPIIYPLSQVPPKWHWVFVLNPMTSVVEIFRYGWLGSGSINYTVWIANAIITIVLFCVGIIAFNYTDKTVVDTV